MPIDAASRRAERPTDGRLATRHLRGRPDASSIAIPTGTNSRHLRLREITPQATWAADDTRWRPRALTRVEFDGGYEQALWDVAGPRDRT